MARSVLIDLMALAHEGEPYGRLADKSGALSDAFMASRCVMTVGKFRAAVQELVSHTRLKRNESGTLLISQMVEDEVRRVTNAANGSRGGNPGLSVSVNPLGKGVALPDSRAHMFARAGSGSDSVVGSISEGGAGGAHYQLQPLPRPLVEAFHQLAELWQKPCECCAMQFAWKDEMLGAQIWISLIGKGAITAANLPEIMDGLRRWRASKEWHEKDGKYVPKVTAWLGYSNSGMPAAPKWRDKPAAKGAYD